LKYSFHNSSAERNFKNKNTERIKDTDMGGTGRRMKKTNTLHVGCLSSFVAFVVAVIIIHPYTGKDQDEEMCPLCRDEECPACRTEIVAFHGPESTLNSQETDAVQTPKE